MRTSIGARWASARRGRSSSRKEIVRQPGNAFPPEGTAELRGRQQGLPCWGTGGGFHGQLQQFINFPAGHPRKRRLTYEDLTSKVFVYGKRAAQTHGRRTGNPDRALEH